MKRKEIEMRKKFLDKEVERIIRDNWNVGEGLEDLLKEKVKKLKNCLVELRVLLKEADKN